VVRISTISHTLNHRVPNDPDLIEAYYEDCELKGISPGAIRRYKTSF
jgi:hypothetical protein